MKKTIFDEHELQKEFQEYDRDYYSLDGYEALLMFYDEIDEDMELDVIAICGDCTEYGNYSSCDFRDLINDYNYIYTKEEYLSDNNLEENDFNEDEYISELINKLENKTDVLHLSNGDYIIFSF